jgi:hypothetical protein
MAKADVNYLERDAIYRDENRTNYINASEALARILGEGQNRYLSIDQQRQADLVNKRNAGQTQAANAAARGLGTSGIAAKNAGRVLTDSAKQQSATSASEDQVRNEYGVRSMVQDQSQQAAMTLALDTKNYTELAKIFGLLGSNLGSQGLGTYNQFNMASGKSEADAATRAAEKAFKNTGRWR